MKSMQESEISAFLSQYNETFATYDGDQIAALYSVQRLPAIAVCYGSVPCPPIQQNAVEAGRAVAGLNSGAASSPLCPPRHHSNL